MPSPRRPRRTRCSALVLGLALATLGLGACGGDDAGQGGQGASASTGAAAAAGWSFTDDSGRTTTLDRVPTRIAGYGDEVAALWNLGIEPVAVFGFQPMAEDGQFDGKDLSGVAEVGTTYGEINIEALAAADPDIIVVTSYPGEDDLIYGFADSSQQAAVEAIAPIVAIRQEGSALDVAERNAELAASLGVDLDGPEVAAARADFEAARAELTEAGEKGLRVLVLAAYPTDGLYLAKAPDDPALSFYQSLGVDFAPVGGDGYYWQQLGWENAGMYPVDVVLYSPRAMGIEGLMAQPSFAVLPAAVAGQVHPWETVSMDHASLAAAARNLAAWLDAAQPTGA
jgi:iron complex transport system substrate-binding protein